ncbi:Uncharacterized protein AArcCO_1768 [Halalkaliarchaeum sp. AArc-CO]|uniref:hypothetical protein n=1 Tax=unclassified Halalkaliarchaeum TaxID=2678344 RepID=UPI00217DE6CD|nr:MULTISPECIES: hypothetical protein [unclassified Halalkaliarchaeum]MDR5671567.1 hypothetical protein [Halalkaliarchaeum sp. AArc-GB]UWG51067.1 Uncharacterized protein AArcCO_1768 [Halalkaliarchaeum sp. AArc-CO]
MNRRAVLAGTGVALLSGCLGLREDTVRLCELSVHNHTDSVHTVELQLLDGEKVVYDEKHVLGPPTEGYEKEVYVLGSELESREGEFSLRVRRDDADWRTASLADRGDSLTVRIFTREAERLPELEIGYIHNPDC